MNLAQGSKLQRWAMKLTGSSRTKPGSVPHTVESTTPKVLYVGNILAHYREETFVNLDSDDRYSFEFAGDLRAIGGIRSVDVNSLKSVHQLKNKQLGRLVWQQGLLKLLFSHQYATVILMGDASFVSTWVAAIILRLRHVPVIFWTMGWRIPEEGARRAIRLAFYRLANVLMLYGQRALEIGTALGYPPRRMQVIYNAIGSSNGTDSLSKQSEPLLDKTWTIGAVSRITKQKRFDILIDAAEILESRGIHISIALVGDGSEQPRLAHRAKSQKVSLEFLPAIYSPASLADFYARVSLCVLPSAAGLSVIQSLSYGVPVITDDNLAAAGPETEAIVPGLTGGLYQAHDANDLADMITTWLSRVRQDPASVARACIDEVERNWTPKSQARRILEIVDRAIIP